MSSRLPETLSIEAAAAFLKIHPRGLRRWIELGRLHPLRDGRGRVVFRRSELLTALDRQHADPGPRSDPPEMG